MKIYTRTGDEGTTGLFGGDRVIKSHPRIEAYGTVDELNAVLGLTLAHIAAPAGATADEATTRMTATLLALQDDLFVLGADLATPEHTKPFVPRIEPHHIERLEAEIDGYDGEVPALKHFILPGGTLGAASLHVARTVCRRAERLAVEAATRERFNERAIVYLNRLSDLLFVLARWANHAAGHAEAEWIPVRPAG